VTVAPDDPHGLASAISDALAGRATTDRVGAIMYARQFTAARIADFYLAEYQAMLTAPGRACASALEPTA